MPTCSLNRRAGQPYGTECEGKGRKGRGGRGRLSPQSYKKIRIKRQIAGCVFAETSSQ